jgi:hypothetical protein
MLPQAPAKAALQENGGGISASGAQKRPGEPGRLTL